MKPVKNNTNKKKILTRITLSNTYLPLMYKKIMWATKMKFFLRDKTTWEVMVNGSNTVPSSNNLTLPQIRFSNEE